MKEFYESPKLELEVFLPAKKIALIDQDEAENNHEGTIISESDIEVPV